jgi:hypothetical protein
VATRSNDNSNFFNLSSFLQHTHTQHLFGSRIRDKIFCMYQEKVRKLNLDHLFF